MRLFLLGNLNLNVLNVFEIFIFELLNFKAIYIRIYQYHPYIKGTLTQYLSPATQYSTLLTGGGGRAGSLKLCLEKPDPFQIKIYP